MDERARLATALVAAIQEENKMHLERSNAEYAMDRSRIEYTEARKRFEIAVAKTQDAARAVDRYAELHPG